MSESEPESDGDQKSDASSGAGDKRPAAPKKTEPKPKKEPNSKTEPKKATRKPRAVQPKGDEIASRWKLAGCRTDVTLAQAVECPGVLPESKELLQKQWDACKPLWFSHPVDELADRLKGALANQPDKAVGNQVCFQRKVPLQAQDVPLFLHLCLRAAIRVGRRASVGLRRAGLGFKGLGFSV